jgi:hypothetical protein
MTLLAQVLGDAKQHIVRSTRASTLLVQRQGRALLSLRQSYALLALRSETPRALSRAPGVISPRAIREDSISSSNVGCLTFAHNNNFSGWRQRPGVHTRACKARQERNAVLSAARHHACWIRLIN